MQKEKILVVEDEIKLARFLSWNSGTKVTRF